MDHFRHPACNGTLSAPTGQESNVDDLHVCKGFSEEYGCHVVQSFWKPSSDELALLLSGACVMLSVFGRTHAPLSVGVAAWRGVPDKDVARSAVETLVQGMSDAGFAVRVWPEPLQPLRMSNWRHMVEVTPKFVRLEAAC